MPTEPQDTVKPFDPMNDGQGTATPDEAGPHDVPDEEVIEQTLPVKPSRDSGDRPA